MRYFWSCRRRGVIFFRRVKYRDIVRTNFFRPIQQRTGMRTACAVFLGSRGNELNKMAGNGHRVASNPPTGLVLHHMPTNRQKPPIKGTLWLWKLVNGILPDRNSLVPSIRSLLPSVVVAFVPSSQLLIHHLHST
jgi:hypothetical protein